MKHKAGHRYSSDEWFTTVDFTVEDIRKVQLSHEHFYEELPDLYSLDWVYKITAVSIKGPLFPALSIILPLPAYPYCPDVRLQTFKLLGKDSPGLPPPFSFLF
ncbi:MAG: hypothetical protein M9948_15150 [Lentimicrobium sp.]|nr:hypothetical protein [Lentimicrobium sp.]